MCGIYLTNKPFSKKEIEVKLQKIHYRGPDNFEVSKVNDVSLGHLRLSIMDLDNRSNQPYQYKNLWITYNGEIYNYESLRDELIARGLLFETTSDTEVLIKGYSIWGKDLLPKLNGMFAFAIYDSNTNNVFCARDRLGVKPFYYYWNRGNLEICSQLSPLSDRSLKINEEAISIYLDCGYIPSPLSIYKDISKLQPGFSLSIDLEDSSLTVEKYWDLGEVHLDRTITYDEAKNNLHELLIDAVKIRMQSDVPLGSFLSGGIDSALVSAIASKYSDNKLRTFTIAFEDPKYDESKVAEQYSNIIGSEHISTLCTSKDVLEMLPKLVEVYDEPFADSSALPSLLLNKVTKKHVTVALSGDGGDESFIGYKHMLMVEDFKKISWIPFKLRKLISVFPFYNIVGVKPETYRNILRCKDEDEFIINTFLSLDKISLNDNKRWVGNNYSNFKVLSNISLQKIADLNIKLWLENDSNTKVDRASMAYSVESRSPFLDYRIIEYARNLPIHFRYDNGITKKILKDILEEYIPKEIFTKPKKGFSVPLGDWIRKELKEDIILKLNTEFLNSLPGLNVNVFKKQLESHFKENHDYSFNIWKLYVLALWFENYNKN